MANNDSFQEFLDEYKDKIEDQIVAKMSDELCKKISLSSSDVEFISQQAAITSVAILRCYHEWVLKNQ